VEEGVVAMTHHHVTRDPTLPSRIVVETVFEDGSGVRSAFCDDTPEKNCMIVRDFMRLNESARVLPSNMHYTRPALEEQIERLMK
jgi:hypothetical protein